MGPGSFQWCPATEQGAMGPNWNIGSSIWTWEKVSLLQQNTGTGCPEKLWSLLLWRCLKPSWMLSCVTCCSNCFGEVGLGWSPDILSNLYNSVILWYMANSLYMDSSVYMQQLLLSIKNNVHFKYCKSTTETSLSCTLVCVCVRSVQTWDIPVHCLKNPLNLVIILASFQVFLCPFLVVQ